MKIGYLLGELRALMKASQQEVADLLNIERSTYTKWENDKTTVNLYKLADIAKIYGMDLELLGRCIEAGKVISKNDITRLIEIAKSKREQE